ncbi:hypothetical protein CDOO_02695 [Corynebacterium doosanense CAU 212 = DSM 45436]|uniref:Uncharacterized protein n=1 Tax=Corynebacterium doosanense CAU 212 = DSM 45436 TaxID=558173 RepID=A0A097IJB9_9CORY|nr:hypothetical protein CDOO_02695 [Corynebacterium doosanense CAU 212 = DSM 45436]
MAVATIQATVTQFDEARGVTAALGRCGGRGEGPEAIGPGCEGEPKGLFPLNVMKFPGSSC